MQKNIEGNNLALFIVENQNFEHKLINCVLKEDEQQLGERFAQLTEFGRANLKQKQPYLPLNIELCVVLYPDSDGLKCWYRGKYQQKLSNNCAQVGTLIKKMKFTEKGKACYHFSKNSYSMKSIHRYEISRLH